MSRALHHRVARLEIVGALKETPNRFFSIVPISETDQPVTPRIIERWLADGLAHFAFGGRVVMYDGGLPKLTSAEWQARFGPAQP